MICFKITGMNDTYDLGVFLLSSHPFLLCVSIHYHEVMLFVHLVVSSLPPSFYLVSYMIA